MIKLIADGGSTKTDWLLMRDECEPLRITTQGINPFMLSENEITLILTNELLTAEGFVQPTEVEYYGAGCRGEGSTLLETVLRKSFPAATHICVGSDLIGAARALFGYNADGIACILGTGSNSGLYLGGQIVENVSPLGYILGDEGSGAVLGRRLVGDVLKRQLPTELCQAFNEAYHLSGDDIIQHVYKQPFGNRFLAQFTRFLAAHRSHSAIHALLIEEFERFFRRNVATYQRPDLPVSFVGSIAYYFSNELKEATQKCGFTVGKIMKAPL